MWTISILLLCIFLVNLYPTMCDVVVSIHVMIRSTYVSLRSARYIGARYEISPRCACRCLRRFGVVGREGEKACEKAKDRKASVSKRRARWHVTRTRRELYTVPTYMYFITSHFWGDSFPASELRTIDRPTKEDRHIHAKAGSDGHQGRVEGEYRLWIGTHFFFPPPSSVILMPSVSLVHA